MERYIPILIFIFFSFFFSFIPILMGSLLSPNKANKEKISTYECGFEPFEDSKIKFNIKFYFVGILFIIFDIEVAFLFPWSICIDAINIEGIISMIIFLFILLLGLLYEWKIGALEWE